MDPKNFLIECWKAVELFNSGQTGSKPWEQLELLKDKTGLGQYTPDIAIPLRNIISALKKMFKGDRYQELYFLRKTIDWKKLDSSGGEQALNRNRINAFLWGRITMIYTGMDDYKKAADAKKMCLEFNDTKFGKFMHDISRAFLYLLWTRAGEESDFKTIFDHAELAAKYIEPFFREYKFIEYDKVTSWTANSLMRTAAIGYYMQHSGNIADTYLTKYSNYLNDNITGRGSVPSDSVISSDLGIAQQSACAAYYAICKRKHRKVLDEMERMDKQRLMFINGTSLFNPPPESPFSKSEPGNDKFLFYVLRRWNSFTPIVPDLKDKDRIYRGGGYFIWHNDKGTVIDPGFRFIRNFAEAGGRVADIDNIVITHAHNDHTADLESIFTVLYQHNATIKDTVKEIGAYLSSLQVANQNGISEWSDISPLAIKTTLWTIKFGITPSEGSGSKTTKNDWAMMREILIENGATSKDTIKDSELWKNYENLSEELDEYGITQDDWATIDAVDCLIISMCLTKREKTVTYKDKDQTTKKYAAKASSAEDILKAMGHAMKKVTVYTNLGTMRKFNAIIDPDSQYINYIADVHIIHPQDAPVYLANAPKGTIHQAKELKMIVHKAYHNEVVTKRFATGLEFVFSKNPNSPHARVLITSDTSLCWTFKPDSATGDEDFTKRPIQQFSSNEVLASYPKAPGTIDVLIPHIGSIKGYEITPPNYYPKNFIYGNHLGLFGVSQLIAKTKPAVTLITEFGEEMTDIIELSVNMAQYGAEGILKQTGKDLMVNPSIVAADIGLVFDMDPKEYHQCAMDFTKDYGDAIPQANLTATYKNNSFPVTYKDKTKL